MANSKNESITLISLNAHYTATRQEIATVWKLISRQPTITTRRIAGELRTSPNRVHYMIQYLKRLGHISRSGRRHAFEIHTLYVEVQR